MHRLLHVGVLISGAWALLALLALLARSRAYGRLEYFASPAGRPAAGVAYAFGPAMSPAAKESAREHLPTYFGGVGYHLGIFASLAYLALLLAGVPLATLALRVFQGLMLCGALCGASLLIKRLVTRHLRGLSCPDDYVANVLTTAFAALAFATTLSPRMEPVLLIEAAVLLLYVPLGKIKHCFFFFTTRYYMGAHFGRRGTFPPGA
jgi:hypothetical protein